MIILRPPTRHRVDCFGDWYDRWFIEGGTPASAAEAGGLPHTHLLSMAATSGRARASTTRAASASLYVAVSARLLQITVLSPSGASANCRLAT